MTGEEGGRWGRGVVLVLSWLVARQITCRKRPCADYDSRDVAENVDSRVSVRMPDASSLVNVTSSPVTAPGEQVEKNRRYSNLAASHA